MAFNDTPTSCSAISDNPQSSVATPANHSDSTTPGQAAVNQNTSQIPSSNATPDQVPVIHSPSPSGIPPQDQASVTEVASNATSGIALGSTIPLVDPTKNQAQDQAPVTRHPARSPSVNPHTDSEPPADVPEKTTQHQGPVQPRGRRPRVQRGRPTQQRQQQRQRQQPRPVVRTFSPPSGQADELENDLLAFGLSPRDIEVMISGDKSNITTQHAEYMTIPTELVLGKRSREATVRLPVAKKARGNRPGEYKTLVLGEDQNWILFDARLGFPLLWGEAPAVFDRFARYEPGNPRIVEQNVKTSALRLRTTPQNFQGKFVEYTTTGPKLCEMVEILFF